MATRKSKLVIAVCGSAGGKLSKDALAKSRKIGEHLARSDVVVITPGTIGYTHAVGKAAKKAGAFSLGISPAESREEHIKHYKRPIDAWDAIVFTGLGFKGRNVTTIQSADAVIFIGGGTGTLNEFTIAYDHQKPIGILDGVKETMELVDQIVERTYKPSPPIVREEDPKVLVEKIVAEAKKYVQRTSGGG